MKRFSTLRPPWPNKEVQIKTIMRYLAMGYGFYVWVGRKRRLAAPLSGWNNDDWWLAFWVLSTTNLIQLITLKNRKDSLSYPPPFIRYLSISTKIPHPIFLRILTVFFLLKPTRTIFWFLAVGAFTRLLACGPTSNVFAPPVIAGECLN